MAAAISRDDALALDAEDPIAAFRDRFVLPRDLIYLDGNSLGPPPLNVQQRVGEVMAREWGADLIGGWTKHGWIDLPGRIAGAIAPLIGASQGEVVVADSTSVNLFKLLAAALRLRSDRPVILSERDNFPTDLYIAEGLVGLLGGGASLRLVDRADLADGLGPDVAVVMLTHVDFRTGAMHDMAARTAAAHECGALVLWDLSHSAGAVPVELDRHQVDLAVGCGYKYLNGGPGAPAFAFAARRHHQELRSPLSGWMGHASPFDFDVDYRPAPGVDRLLAGTPPILSLAALECGVESIAAIGMDLLRAKSVALTELFIALVEGRCADFGIEIVSPREAALRGSQVSLRHPGGYAVMQALIAAGVVGDFRHPDLLRFGFAPAYVRFVDVWDAVERLREILDSAAWDRAEYRVRGKVT
jgi:kynureninase